MFSSAMNPMASLTSTDAVPICGSSTVSSRINPAGTSGSFSYTSSPAPPIAPASSAAISAPSSTQSPRLTLTRIAWGRIAENSSAPMRCRVDGEPGTQQHTTSERAISSPSEAI